MDASGPRLRDLAADVLRRIEAADPFAITKAIELCEAILTATSETASKATPRRAAK